ncbi:universal stress protein [Labrys portucalensis]|uniref:Universal stress protein n=1 Tax=Labrys neptuniae TaxID=376174 RepID=A0ABV6Z8E6_9HYPH
MKYLVGLSADQGGREALALGAVLSRSCGASLVVCTVTPDTWGPPSPARVDGEYGSFLHQHATKAQEKARASLPPDVQAEFVIVSAPSAREGLLQVASDIDADCLVLGSTRAAPLGRFGEGHVTTDVLRSAHLPVAVAPRGYSADARTQVRRLSCAFAGSTTSPGLARRSADLAQLLGVPLRLVTLVVRDKQMYPTGAGYDAENIVSNTLREQASAAQAAVLEHWDGPVAISGEIGDGKNWKAAFDSLLWANAELLVVGSSSLGPVMRVFLGSNSSKIAHNSPVPCLILPRVDE